MIKIKKYSKDMAIILPSESMYAPEIKTSVADIIRNIGEKPNLTLRDNVLLKYTEKFDCFTPKSLRVSEAEIAEAVDSLPDDVRESLKFAEKRIRSFHEKQLPQNTPDPLKSGASEVADSIWSPVKRAGIYVPGGTASYPSSVLMNVIPAQIAGVSDIAMVTPAPKGVLNPITLGAAGLVGIEEIYCVGGAQAIAALAFGTETIDPVDVIVGPGNAYVAEAKRQVLGFVGIDTIAGPSEILIVADENNNPEWVAADLLSQAEHDEDAQAVLCTDSRPFAEKVNAEIEKLLETLPRKEIAEKSLKKWGEIIVFDTLADMPYYINTRAPEHLHIALADDKAEKFLGEIQNAGAIFIGPYTPEVIGDYVGGPNHVLPTGRAVRFSSGLSVLSFMKRSSILKCDEGSFAKLAPYAEILAEAEGLSAHALAVRLRRKK
ncbi:MAG: histidinol dehydrogenase [Parvibaculales bacterium]